MDSIILDGEILMMDLATHRPLPFGTLNVHKKSEFAQACVCVFWFDVLYLNGRSLLNVPLRERRRLLEKHVRVIPDRMELSEQYWLGFVNARDTACHSAERPVPASPWANRAACAAATALANRASPAAAEAARSAWTNGIFRRADGRAPADALLANRQFDALMRRAMDDGLEGLVVKDAEQVYEVGARHWSKIKKDYIQGMADTVDLVVIGGNYGSGAKGGLVSIFLMGTHDESICTAPEGKEDDISQHVGCFKTVTRVGNGFDDASILAMQVGLVWGGGEGGGGEGGERVSCFPGS